MWSFGPMGISLTHTQSRNTFSLWEAGKSVSSKVKGHWPRFDSVVTKTTETKSDYRWETTHGMVLKLHKDHKLHYFQIQSLYLGNFRKPLNNPTSTKFTLQSLHYFHLSWYVIVFVAEMPNFITNYELKFWVYKELVIYIFCDFSHKSHAMDRME